MMLIVHNAHAFEDNELLVIKIRFCVVVLMNDPNYICFNDITWSKLHNICTIIQTIYAHVIMKET